MLARGTTSGLFMALTVQLAVTGCSQSNGNRPLSDGGATGTSRLDSGGLGTLDSGRQTATNITNITNPSGNGDAEVCNQTRGAARSAAGTLMFQLDTSGSMNCAPNDGNRNCSNNTGNPNGRWNVFRPALLEALDSLSEASKVGIMNYPIAPTNNPVDPAARGTCVDMNALVPIATLDNTQRMTIAAALGNIRPGGFTPTQPAVELAYQRLNDAPDDFNAMFLILATDGESNVCVNCGPTPNGGAGCSETSGIETAVRNAQANGIRTFIIGVPGSDEYRDTLSTLAELGDTAAPGCDQNACATRGTNCCHFDLTNSGANFGAELRTALANILGQVQVPCEYEVPPGALETSDASQVIVELTDDNRATRLIRQGIDWDFSADMSRIVLGQSACAEVSTYVTGQVNILYGCPILF